MSGCVGCEPGCNGDVCGCGGYKPTDFTLAISSRDACRFDVPEEPPMLVRWRGKEGVTVKVNAHETGTVVAVRERDMSLMVELDSGSGAYVFPMRTTEEVV